MRRNRRNTLLRGALATLVLAAAVLSSAVLAPAARAEEGGCAVICKDGSSCGVATGPGEICTCACSSYGHGPATCTCKQLKPSVPG